MKTQVRKAIRYLENAKKKLKLAKKLNGYQNNIDYDLSIEINSINNSISELKFLL